MSGPKVVNIEAVSRQQRRASLANLRRLELALAECERWQAQPQASALLERLHKMREAEQWEPLSVETAKLTGFYEEEAHRLRQRHAEEQATRLRRAHRLRQGTAQMTWQLQSQPAAPERDRLLAQLASGDLAAQETALNEVLRFLEKKQRDENSTRLRELAAGLMDANTSDPALPQAPADPQEQRLEKCWNLLGELSALEEPAKLQPLIEKAQRISLAPVDQQALLLDSLALELSTHLQNRRVALAVQHELEFLIGELEVIRSSEAAAWKQHLAAALAQPLPLDPAHKLVKEARAWIEQTIAEETRHEQRAAILRALAVTGYEVREGMATALVEQGRLILRKPNESAYGIELSVPAQGSAVQTRVVALGGAPRDPRRDLEVEETWCGEFAKAREALNEDGFNATLIHAHPAGSITLKMVAIPTSNRIERQISKLREAPQKIPEG